MARAPKLTPEQKAEIIRLREEHKTPYNALAVQFGVSSQTIIRICRPEFYDRQKKANREYQGQNTEAINERRKERYRNYRLAFHTDNDGQVIEFLDKQDNIQDYVRQKVIADIKAENTEEGPER